MTKEMSVLLCVTCWFIIGYEKVWESCVLIKKPSSKMGFFFLYLEENCISDDFIYLLICF